MRPYFSVQPGIIVLARDRIDFDRSNIWYGDYIPIPKMNVTYPQVTGEFGVNFEFGERFPLFVGVHVFALCPFGNTTVIGNFNTGSGILIGLNIF